MSQGLLFKSIISSARDPLCIPAAAHPKLRYATTRHHRYQVRAGLLLEKVALSKCTKLSASKTERFGAVIILQWDTC